jgi:hypothetical protein
LIKQRIRLRLEGAVRKLVVAPLLFLIESENQVLLLLIQRLIQPIRGIYELLFVQWLLKLLKLDEEWLEQLLHLIGKDVQLHLLGGHEAILVVVQLVKYFAHFVSASLHYDLLAEFAGLALVAHLVEAFVRVDACLLLFLLDELVPVVELVRDVPPGVLAVSQVEVAVDLGLEHLAAALGVNGALVLDLSFLFMQVVINLCVLCQAHEHFGFGTLLIF